MAWRAHVLARTCGYKGFKVRKGKMSLVYTDMGLGRGEAIWIELFLDSFGQMQDCI